MFSYAILFNSLMLFNDSIYFQLQRHYFHNWLDTYSGPISKLKSLFQSFSLFVAVGLQHHSTEFEMDETA